MSLESPALAKKYYGQANDFFTYGVGGRALSMGSAYVALAEDASAPYWNPAGMDRSVTHQIMFMHTQFFEGTSYDYFGTIHPFRRMGALGIALVHLRSGGFEKTNGYGDSLGSGSVSQSALFGSYAKSLYGVSLGSTFKVVREDNLNNSGTGFGLDLGAMAPLGLIHDTLKPLTFGLAVGNILEPEITLKNSPNTYETNLRAGLALKLLSDSLIASVDMNKLKGQDYFITSGIEITPWKPLSLRFGYNQTPDLTYGVGFKWTTWQLDYGLNSNDLGLVHKVSLSYAWGNVYKAHARPESQGKWGKSQDIELEGLENTVNFTISVPKFAVKDWKLVIKEKRKPIRSFEGFSRPPEEIPWDVKDELGRPVPEGEYTYEWTVVYDDGEVWKSRGKLKLKARIPTQDLDIDAVTQ